MSVSRFFAHLIANRCIIVLLTTITIFLISVIFRPFSKMGICENQPISLPILLRAPKLPFFCKPRPELDCFKLFEGNYEAMNKAKRFTLSNNSIVDLDEIFHNKNNCVLIRSLLDLPTKPLSVKEEQFRLAYVMIVHSDFHLILRLLMSLYWPQNSYCIHLDAKATDSLAEALRSIAKCYSNIYFLESRVNVYWGHPNILESAMRCFKVLKNLRNPWRYVQITSESDFPLKTNAEMVEILSIFNGSQDCALAEVRSTTEMERVVYSHRELLNASTNQPDMCGPVWYRDKTKRKSLPPGNVRIYKGWLASALTKDFVNYLFENRLALELYEWFKDTCIPEEHYWATLIHNQHLKAPGTFPGFCYDVYRHKNISKPFISRYQKWKGFYCGGKWVRSSCLYGVDHLPNFIDRKELMAHKFNLTYQPAALYCLNELICNRTYSISPVNVDSSYYQYLPSVRYANAQNKATFVC